MLSAWEHKPRTGWNRGNIQSKIPEYQMMKENENRCKLINKQTNKNPTLLTNEIGII